MKRSHLPMLTLFGPTPVPERVVAVQRAHHPNAGAIFRLLAMVALVSLLIGSFPPPGVNAAAGPSPTTIATTVVSLVAKGDFAAAERYFSPTLQAALPVAGLRQTWQQLTAQVGTFERQTGTQEQTTGGLKSVVVHCIFAKATADLVIGFDTAGKVGGLNVTNVQPTGPRAAEGTPGITPEAALIRVLTSRPIQSSWLAPSFLLVVSAGQLEQGIAGITTQLGPYKSLTPVPAGGYKVLFRDGTADVAIHLDGQGRIDSLLLSNLQLTLKGLQPQGTPSGVAGRAAAVDALLTKRLQNHQFSGSVLVAVNGNVVMAKGYGYADAAQKRPNTTDTAYRIGSITKQFTAMAILQLQAAGKLSVQDKLCRYVQPCPAAWAPITLQQLLSHTSGIADFTALLGSDSRMSQPTTPAQWLNLMRNVPLDFTPGTKFAYSNSNYYLLGYIIEKVSGQTYASYLQKAIFAPLSLQRTGYDVNRPDLRTHARGYASWNTTASYSRDMSWALGAGALYSSVVDLWRWDKALLSNSLIAKAATAEMFAGHATTCPVGTAACPYTSAQARYGYGWFSGTVAGHLVISHGGDTLAGFTAINEVMPNDGITVVLLSNQADSGASTFLGLALAQIMLGHT